MISCDRFYIEFILIYSIILRQHSQFNDVDRNPYIVRGYRPKGKPYGHYVFSVFRSNNETLSFWTHFLPFLMFVYRYAALYGTYGNSPYVLPFYAHGLGVCYILFSSSFAHMMCSLSYCASKCCFALDYAAIYVYGVSMKIPLEYYLCPTQRYCSVCTPFWTVCLFGLYCTFALAVTFYLRVKERNTSKTTSTIFYVIGTCIIYGSCSMRYFFSSISDYFIRSNDKRLTRQVGEGLGFSFFTQLALLALGLFLFATKIPERFTPGTFDIVGQSHQLFHLSTALAMYAQSLMLESVVLEIERKNLSREFSSVYDAPWLETIGQFLFSLVLTHGVVGFYSVHMCKKHAHANLKPT